VQLCVFGHWKRARSGPQSFPRDAAGERAFPAMVPATDERARAWHVPVFIDFHWRGERNKSASF
jgi:hypothetical protein